MNETYDAQSVFFEAMCVDYSRILKSSVIRESLEDFCDSVVHDKSLMPKCFSKIRCFSGHISLMILTRCGIPFNLHSDAVFEDDAFSAAEFLANAINFKQCERSCLSLVWVAVEVFERFYPELSNLFVECLLDKCAEKGPNAIKNLLYSPWQSYQEQSPITANAIKRALENKGNVVDVLVELAGKNNMGNCFKRLGFIELMPYIKNNQKRNSIESDMGI